MGGETGGNDGSGGGRDGHGDDGGQRYGTWLVGKLLDPTEEEFRNVVTYGRGMPLSEDEVAAVLDRFPKQKLRNQFGSMSRRDFMRRTVEYAGHVLVIKTLGEIGLDAVEDVVSPPAEHFGNFWPNSLSAYADTEGPEPTAELLQESAVDWQTFITRSTSMLREVEPGDEIHVLSFFLRGYNRDFFEAVDHACSRDASVTLSLVDPIEGANGLSAMELHQDREVMVYRQCLNESRIFGRFRSESGSDFGWREVPHLNDRRCNRIRCLCHGLRALETAHLYTELYDGVRVQLISDTRKVPLRARFVFDEGGRPKMASFLKLEKGVIGTSNVTNGHILGDTRDRDAFERQAWFVSEFLDRERRRLPTRGPYSAADLRGLHEEVRGRLDARVETLRAEGVIGEETANTVRNRLSNFECVRPDATGDPFEAWRSRDASRRRDIEAIRATLDEEIDRTFTGADTPFEIDDPSPATLYETVLDWQGLTPS